MTTLIKLKNVSKSFKTDSDESSLVLGDVNLEIHNEEIVVILGKSGAGKSTLLRIIAGLISPTTGQVFYRDQIVKGPLPGISMVFQNFALLPWLNVLQNVELGLEAQNVPKEERRQRAIHAIDIIGMDGFESAFPKELSGGMQQRVGFARALVVNPDLLIMDEPFSSLDVLTAENLRRDLIDLWADKKTNTNGILMVTHNIEEASLVADRILIFSINPGQVIAEIKIPLPHPRNPQSREFRDLVDQIYTIMTTTNKASNPLAMKTTHIGFGYRLPRVSPAELTGLIETMNSEFKNKSKIDLPELADILMMGIDDLFTITEALEILGFAEVSHGDIQLSEAGKKFADADLLERKKLFAHQLLKHIPLIREIHRILDERSNHHVSEERFLSILEYYFSEKEAEKILRTVIDWGRYAELFAYNYNTGILSLENPN